MKTVIKSALRYAMQNNKCFRRKVELVEYLSNTCGIKEAETNADTDWLFDCYLQEKEEAARSRLPPSPSQSANSLAVTSESGPEVEDSRESGDGPVSPEYTSVSSNSFRLRPS